MTTQHFKFETSSKPIIKSDRNRLDSVLARGMDHTHDGSAATVTARPASPDLLCVKDAGNFPAGIPVYYKVTSVDEWGFESAPSLEATIWTASPVSASAPTIAKSASAGTLQLGLHVYGVTVYTDSIHLESTISSVKNYTVTQSASEAVDVTVPSSLPSGATGYNIYVKRPGAKKFTFLTSSTAGSTFTDDAATAVQSNNHPPTINRTFSRNAIQVDFSGSLPSGASWKIYRTLNQSQFQNSFVTHIVESSGSVPTSYVDIGLQTIDLSPPRYNLSIANPSKIELLDGAEVENRLPNTNVSGFPVVYVFKTEDIAVREGATHLPVEFPNLKVLGVRATVKTPPQATIEIDVYHMNQATPASIMGTLPTIAASARAGTRVAPSQTDFVEGDTLRVDITQIDDGTAEGLTVTLFCAAIM